MIGIVANSDIFGLSEQHYGKIKRVGMLNDEPILYGDPNLLKNNDLYYIIGAKQVYRYIKCEFTRTSGPRPGVLDPTPNPGVGNVFDPNAIPKSKEYYFETFNGSDSEVLSVTEDERGKIRNAGYLFNEIIYSGDPNLVDNGLLFYHDTLPYISVISNVDGIINVSTKTIRFDGTTGTIVNEYRVSPEPHDYSKDYLTFEALEDGELTINLPNKLQTENIPYIKYSKDDGNTWVTINNIDNTAVTENIDIKAGDIVLFKSNATQCSTGYGPFYSLNLSANCSHNIKGNIMSLIYEDDFNDKITFKENSVNVFREIFKNNVKLINASTLILPATALVWECYRSMFLGCTSLTTTPVLPATILEYNCYYVMFASCTSLTTTPVLPATTLAQNCYSSMFQNCTSLTIAPVLPATTLANHCYDLMFKNCSNLNYIKAMFTTTPSESYTDNWVQGVAATGTFVKNSVATWNVTGVNGIPTGWTVETADS